MEDAPDKSQLPNTRPTRGRSHAVSFAVSLAAHAGFIAAIVYFAPALATPHDSLVLAYLVEVGDGSSGGSGSMRAGAGATPSIPIRSEAGPLLIPEHPKPHKPVRRAVALSRQAREYDAESPATKVASLAPPASPKPAPAVDSHGLDSGSPWSKPGSSTNAGDSSGSGRGSSDTGGDGDGNSLAHADYGSNPPPIYPASARRRDQQGTVTIRVRVGADGSVERAELAESSGFDALDDAALMTVRRRWRFVPARRGGSPVESWVLVPIRFALTEANAGR